mgnify:FL=1
MSQYDNEYYVLKKIDEDIYPSLTPLKETTSIRFNRKMPEPGQILKFKNRWKDDNETAGINEDIGSVLFNGVDILVDEEIKEILSTESLHKVGYYPAIYISDEDVWIEDYQFVTILNRIDAWSREKSSYDKENVGINNKYYLSKIVLDQSVLDEIPYEKRQLFKLDSSMVNLTLIHKDLLMKFSDCIDSRIAIPVATYQG